MKSSFSARESDRKPRGQFEPTASLKWSRHHHQKVHHHQHSADESLGKKMKKKAEKKGTKVAVDRECS